MTPDEVRNLPNGEHRVRLVNPANLPYSGMTGIFDSSGALVTEGTIRPFTSGRTRIVDGSDTVLIDLDDDVQFFFMHDPADTEEIWQYVDCRDIELAYPDPGDLTSMDDIEQFLKG